MNNRYVVIMAGGRGERFWPQSRLHKPKHLLPIVSENPMIVDTLERAKTLVNSLDNIFIITNKLHVTDILAACPDLNPHQVVGEPLGRDTAPAIALATRLIKEKNPSATFAVLPADHIVHNKEAFKQSLETAFELAESNNCLVTLGIKPTYPATGYGYIQSAEALAPNAFKVQKFVEKPQFAQAQEYVQSGYLWNAGMFVWSVNAIESQFQTHTPQLYQSLFAPQALDALDVIYPKLEKISIDYAILEKAHNIFTVACEFDWDDAGEWLALERHLSSDSAGNTIRGSAITVDAKNNIIISPQGHTTAVMGASNMIIVNTGDATLVCRKDDSQNIKKLLASIQEDTSLTHLI